MGSRRIFVGDVQGCREELERLLEALGFDPAGDELHPVGDLVNRGPDSAGVLRLARELDAGGVLGNHDLHALRAAAGVRRTDPRDTLEDLLTASDGPELLAWLAARPFARSWPDLVLVHAAIHPRWSDPTEVLAGLDPLMRDERTDFVTRTRYCDGAGARPERDWPPPEPPFVPWFELWQTREGEGRTAVFGHWSRLGLVRRPRLVGLDTGCVWGGQLTAWIAEEDRLVAVDAKRAYATHARKDGAG